MEKYGLLFLALLVIWPGTVFAHEWSNTHPVDIPQSERDIENTSRCTTEWCMFYDTAHMLTHIFEELQNQTILLEERNTLAEQSNCMLYYNSVVFNLKEREKLIDNNCNVSYEYQRFSLGW